MAHLETSILNPALDWKGDFRWKWSPFEKERGEESIDNPRIFTTMREKKKAVIRCRFRNAFLLKEEKSHRLRIIGWLLSLMLIDFSKSTWFISSLNFRRKLGMFQMFVLSQTCPEGHKIIKNKFFNKGPKSDYLGKCVATGAGAGAVLGSLPGS